MTKSEVSVQATESVQREVRPFLRLEPARELHATVVHDAIGLARLDAALGDQIPQLARSLVDYTIALQNGRALERGNPQPIQLSVLNRRRRAARSWLVAIAAGKAEAATAHAFATQWLPMLTGTGPDLAAAVQPGRRLVEFVRGACTACLFDAPAENLLTHAKALHVLETTLAAHLGALLQQAPQRA